MPAMPAARRPSPRRRRRHPQARASSGFQPWIARSRKATSAARSTRWRASTACTFSSARERWRSVPPPRRCRPRSRPSARPASIRRRCRRAMTGAATAHDHAGHAGHAHQHGHDEHDEHEPGQGGGIARLGAALLTLALGAEALHFLAGDAPAMRYLGLALAALAIWLSGVETYTKGLKALLRGAPQHQRADERRGHRRLPDRPVAGGRDGHGALRDRRADRSACGRPCAQRDPGPGHAGARAGRGDAGRRKLEDPAARNRSYAARSCASSPASACRSTAWSPRAAAR